MGLMDIIVGNAEERHASDVHIAAGLPVRFRINGMLTDMDDRVLTPEDCDDIAREAAGEQFEVLYRGEEIDLSDTYAGHVRCRLNIYRTMRSVALAIRLLSNTIPKLERLGLPPIVREFPKYQKGIVLVTGETGSGKSTTLASILNEINTTRPDHIITLEDPIEYVYTPDKCSIDQREIGRDTVSYAEGLRSILRQDPDVILIGEMRDLDTIETALTAAETGHLVFGTLHTKSASDSVDRLVDVFPEGRQRQIRLQLSMVLNAVLSQQLLVRRDGAGRVCACEVMIVNMAIRNLIREGKTPQIENALATTTDIGSVTMDNMLIKMARERLISRETALEACRDMDYVKRQVR